MDIPYTVELRRDTGLNNGKIGIWLFLASEVMLFGALFASYILIRTGAPSLAAGRHDSGRPARHVQHDRSDCFLRHDGHGLGVADAPPLRDLSNLHGGDDPARVDVFLVVKYFEYSHHLHLGEFPRTNNFLAIYYTLTGLHMLHVFGGMVVNAYFWGPGAKLWKTNPVWFTNRVGALGPLLAFRGSGLDLPLPDAVSSVDGNHDVTTPPRRATTRLTSTNTSGSTSPSSSH